MKTDTARSGDHHDPRDGTAAIPAVTDAMMDHAAHEAAALADGVAHGTIALEPADDAGPAEGAMAETAEHARDAAGEVSRSTARVAEGALDEAARAAERVADAAQEGASASADTLGRYNAKVAEIVQANIAATSAHFAALVQAKSIPEAVSLNADHLRRQVETLTSQGRELATLAQQAAFAAFAPFRDAMKRGR